MAYHLIKYIKGEDYRRPMVFYVTTDGTDGLYMYCPDTHCRPANPINDIIECERRACIKCKMFARGNKIVWKGGKKKISRKISLEELKVTLKELGFYDGN